MNRPTPPERIEHLPGLGVSERFTGEVDLAQIIKFVKEHNVPEREWNKILIRGGTTNDQYEEDFVDVDGNYSDVSDEQLMREELEYADAIRAYRKNLENYHKYLDDKEIEKAKQFLRSKGVTEL